MTVLPPEREPPVPSLVGFGDNQILLPIVTKQVRNETFFAYIGA